MKINGKKVKTNGYFAYDGCHKMYICESEADVETMRGYGYEYILPIANLPQVWESSCPLRFIQNVKFTKDYVRQCEDAEFDTESEVAE